MPNASDYSTLDSPTPAELRVLQAYANGARRIAGVASALGVASSTVRTHVWQARVKLNANSTAHAVAIALRRQLIN